MRRRSLGATRSTPVSARPRSIKRRSPHWSSRSRGSSAKSIAGRDVGRAVLAVLEMDRQRGQVDLGAGLRRSPAPAPARARPRRSAACRRRRRQDLGSEALGGATPKACANRARLPAHCRPARRPARPRGKARRGDCRRGFGDPARSTAASRRSTSPASTRPSMKRRRRKRSRSPAGAVAVRAAISGFSITFISRSSARLARPNVLQSPPGSNEQSPDRSP